MGGQDLTDNVDGARWLVREMGVDSARIGIYGGSYGGFITLMGMFTTPGVFAAGAALRPVTDWAHYTWPVRVLNDPGTTPRPTAEVAHQPPPASGSPAHLPRHGGRQRAVLRHRAVGAEAGSVSGKANWDVAIYPAERHGFTEISSWRDEYRRIFELFEGMSKRRTAAEP
jgi:dienelactone hydrolase